MTRLIQSPRPYPRAHHHPLISACMAIVWASLLMAGVWGTSKLVPGDVQAGEDQRSEPSSQGEPDATGELDTH